MDAKNELDSAGDRELEPGCGRRRRRDVLLNLDPGGLSKHEELKPVLLGDAEIQWLCMGSGWAAKANS